MAIQKALLAKEMRHYFDWLHESWGFVKESVLAEQNEDSA